MHAVVCVCAHGGCEPICIESGVDVFTGKAGHLTTMARPFPAFSDDCCNKGEQLILHYSYRRIRKKGSWFFVPIQISLAAWSATLPIVHGAFGGSSPYFLAGNLLVVPLITLMIWACIPLLVLADILPQEILDLYETVWLSLMNAAQRLLFVLKELG